MLSEKELKNKLAAINLCNCRFINKKIYNLWALDE